MNLSKMKSLAASLFGIDPARNTVKLDAANAQVSFKAGSKAGIDPALNTVKVDPANNTFKVDPANNVVKTDPDNNTTKDAASSAITAPNVEITNVASVLWPSSAVKQRITAIAVDRKIFIGPAGVTVENGFPVEAGVPTEWETKAAMYAISATDDNVDVRIIKEAF